MHFQLEIQWVSIFLYKIVTDLTEFIRLYMEIYNLSYSISLCGRLSTNVSRPYSEVYVYFITSFRWNGGIYDVHVITSRFCDYRCKRSCSCRYRLKCRRSWIMPMKKRMKACKAYRSQWLESTWRTILRSFLIAQIVRERQSVLYVMRISRRASVYGDYVVNIVTIAIASTIGSPRRNCDVRCAEQILH